MTAAEAQGRYDSARIALQVAHKRANAAKLLPRPANRAETVARLAVADQLRRAEQEYAAAKAAAEGVTRGPL